MKTSPLIRALLAALGLVALAAAGRAEPTPPTPPADSAVPAAPVPATRWSDLKDLTYDHRDAFLSGIKSLTETVDAQVAELTARRAVMEQKSIDAKDWDFAMSAMMTARSYLLGTVDEMGKADRATWDQRKEKVGAAWTTVQDAYAKVKSSTTAG